MAAVLVLAVSPEGLVDRLTGKTVTFISVKGGDPSFVYFGEGNELGGVGKQGFYAINDRNQVCLGWEERDLPQLRCVDVLLIDGKMHKFGPDGALRGHISEMAEGNTT